MGEPVEKQLPKVIRFHRDSLASQRQFMTQSAIVLEEETIELLEHYGELLKEIEGSKNEKPGD